MHNKAVLLNTSKNICPAKWPGNGCRKGSVLEHDNIKLVISGRQTYESIHIFFAINTNDSILHREVFAARRYAALAADLSLTLTYLK